MPGWRSKKRWISTDARATRSRRHGLRSYSRDCQPDLAKAEDQRPVAKLAESLLDHDEDFRLWRLRHVEMVERQIGDKPGTGGSTGVRYLQSTLGKRFFPELWEVRSQL